MNVSTSNSCFHPVQPPFPHCSISCHAAYEAVADMDVVERRKIANDMPGVSHKISSSGRSISQEVFGAPWVGSRNVSVFIRDCREHAPLGDKVLAQIHNGSNVTAPVAVIRSRPYRYYRVIAKVRLPGVFSPHARKRRRPGVRTL